MGRKKTGDREEKKECVARSGRKTLADEQNSGVKFFSLASVADAFSYKFFNEDRCRSWMFEKLHPGGARCPDCGLVLDGAARESFWAGRRCTCNRCGRRFTARTKTFLDGAQLDDRQIYALGALLNIGFTPARVAEIIEITPNTVRIWASKFKIFQTI